MLGAHVLYNATALGELAVRLFFCPSKRGSLDFQAKSMKFN